MMTLTVVVLSLLMIGGGAIALIRGAANEIDRMAEIEEAQLRIDWPLSA
ncbi:hypothetical protein [Caballeronia sp. INDeC2]|nr:hypothetical protein [Caballeronia sp. INDeC2]